MGPLTFETNPSSRTVTRESLHHMKSTGLGPESRCRVADLALLQLLSTLQRAASNTGTHCVISR